MNISELIERLNNASYVDTTGKKINLIKSDSEDKLLKQIINEWYMEQGEELDRIKKISELETICYVYETIIRLNGLESYLISDDFNG